MKPNYLWIKQQPTSISISRLSFPADCFLNFLGGLEGGAIDEFTACRSIPRTVVLAFSPVSNKHRAEDVWPETMSGTGWISDDDA